MSRALSVRDFEFQGSKIRCTGTNRDPWFVAKDVADALGIVWASSTLANIPAAWKGVRKLLTPMKQKGGSIRVVPTEMLCINESGLYKLVFRSNKPEADAFTNWVASEVLPSIRKSGFYAAKRQEKALAAGKGLDWVEKREEGVVVRKTFTDVLRDHEVVDRGYPDCTNAIYQPVLGGSAAKVKVALGLRPKANLRDSLSTADLVKVMFAEMMAAGRIEKDDVRGNIKCHDVCRLAGAAVATAIRIASEGSLGPPEPPALPPA